MRNRDEDIRQAGNADELRELLEWMMMETERITANRRMTFDETHTLAQHLTHIRLLLNELSSYEAWRSAADAATFPATGLVLRFLELEGKVKEIRNDLYRPPCRDRLQGP